MDRGRQYSGHIPGSHRQRGKLVLPATMSCVHVQTTQQRSGGSAALQGAGETGKAEAYMCSRIMRDPIVRQNIAEYQARPPALAASAL